MTAAQRLKAPYPAFGGKGRVAADVWERLGNVDNFIESFCFSAAVLLARPHAPKVETINDANHFVANFWRAVAADPDAVAAHADWPVNEADMHARHRWLMKSRTSSEFRERMKSDPDAYDARIAGWWCWGACCWIGTGWCDDSRSESIQIPRLSEPLGVGVDADSQGAAFPRQIPRLSTSGGQGIHMGRVQLADAFSRGRGVNGNDAAETCADRRAWLTSWMRRLSDRLRTTRVCCGDWSRICSSDSTTTRLGTTGIFLDPPYAQDTKRLHAWIRHLDGEGPEPAAKGKSTNRDGGIYGTDLGDMDRLVAGVHRYCREWGAKPNIRIVLAGYQGEHDALESIGWESVAWKGSGYGNRTEAGKDNAARERLWISPNCLAAEKNRMPLFDAAS